MANNKNLIPQQHKLTVEEQSKGGKKSVKAKKQKKYIKEKLEELMLMDLKDYKIQENMRNFGIIEADMNIQNAICVALVQQAIHRKFESLSINKRSNWRKSKRRRCRAIAKYIFS